MGNHLVSTACFSINVYPSKVVDVVVDDFGVIRKGGAQDLREWDGMVPGGGCKLKKKGSASPTTGKQQCVQSVLKDPCVLDPPRRGPRTQIAHTNADTVVLPRQAPSGPPPPTLPAWLQYVQ